MADITVITFPRNISRLSYSNTIFSTLDIYCTVIDPDEILPEIDIVIFTSPNKVKNIGNTKAAIIILSTWGDTLIETKKTIQYLSPHINNFNINYILEKSSLIHKQLLYYDRISVKIKDENNKNLLHNLVSNHLYSPLIMEQIIENNDYNIHDDKKETELCPKLFNLISNLQKYSNGTSIIYTSVSVIVDNLLSLSKLSNSYLVCDDPNIELNENRISSIHILDGYSLQIIKNLLENVFNINSYDEINIHLYVGIHPDIDSLDIQKYEQLNNDINVFDEIYNTATQSFLIEDNLVYKW